MSRASVDADAFNAFEAAGWEHQVSGYEDFFGPITTRLVGPLLDAAEVDRGARVLDVASGPGYVAAAAAERGAFVIGVDIAEGMLSLARRRHPQLDFRFGDAEALPFDDGSLDAVVANSRCCTSGAQSEPPPSSRACWTPTAASRSPSGTSPSRRGFTACSSTPWRRREPVRRRTSR